MKKLNNTELNVAYKKRCCLLKKRVRCSKIFRKIHRQTPVLKSLRCNFNKETPPNVFSRNFCAIFKITCLVEHLQTAASVFKYQEYSRHANQ